MNDLYLALRLAEESKLAERAQCDRERSVRLRACYLLCCMLSFRLERPRPRRLARRLR